MNKSLLTRLIIDLLMFISVINGWWFVTFPLIIVGLWLFPFFIETILAGIVYDSLFGLVPETGIWAYIGTIVSIATFFMFIIFRGKFR